MPVEIQCPGCRFPFRADDEFVGESAPCPFCGANIAVPNLQTGGITRRVGHRTPARDQRLRCDPREGNTFPPHLRLPIPQHGEPRPVELVEPDEDHPWHGDYWPFGSAEPPGPRMRGLYQIRSSAARVASLPAEPLKRLQPLFAFVSATVGRLIVFGGSAYWLLDGYPYLALVVGLAGCWVIYACVHDPGEIGGKRLPTAAEDETEEPMIDSEISETRRHDDLD